MRFEIQRFEQKQRRGMSNVQTGKKQSVREFLVLTLRSPGQTQQNNNKNMTITKQKKTKTTNNNQNNKSHQNAQGGFWEKSRVAKSQRNNLRSQQTLSFNVNINTTETSEVGAPIKAQKTAKILIKLLGIFCNEKLTKCRKTQNFCAATNGFACFRSSALVKCNIFPI